MHIGGDRGQLGLVEIISISGFALFYAWHFSLILWLAPSYAADGPTAIRLLLQVAYLVGTTVGTLIFSRIRPASKFKVLPKPAVRAIGALIGCLPALMLGFGIGLGTQQGYLVFGVLMFLAGVDTASIFGIWEDVNLELETSNLVTFVAHAFCLGAVLFILLRAFFPEQCAILSVLCLLGMTSLHYIVERYFPPSGEDVGEHVEDDEAQHAPSPVPAQPRGIAVEANLLLLVVSVGFGFAMGLISAVDLTYFLAGLCGGLVLCLALLLWMQATGRVPSIETVEMGCATLIVIALIVVLAGRSLISMLVGACIIIAAWFVYRALSGGLLIRFAILNGCPSVRFLAASKLSVNCGMPLGWGMVCLLSATGMDETALIVVTAAIAALTVALAFLRFNPEPAASDDALLTPQSNSIQAFMAKCMKVADLYQLSPREGEILCYLARGRNARHIAEELIISEHTVKSHIYRIYRKMDVHSRQDLIDLVETSFPDEMDGEKTTA